MNKDWIHTKQKIKRKIILRWLLTPSYNNNVHVLYSIQNIIIAVLKFKIFITNTSDKPPPPPRIQSYPSTPPPPPREFFFTVLRMRESGKLTTALNRRVYGILGLNQRQQNVHYCKISSIFSLDMYLCNYSISLL